jgi:hypothetical protein
MLVLLTQSYETRIRLSHTNQLWIEQVCVALIQVSVLLGAQRLLTS